MTKRLPPERIAEILRDEISATPAAELRGHIEAIEAELKTSQLARDAAIEELKDKLGSGSHSACYSAGEMAQVAQALHDEQAESKAEKERRVDAELELAESKAEIARLESRLRELSYIAPHAPVPAKE